MSKLTRTGGKLFSIGDVPVESGDRLHVNWPSGFSTTETASVVPEHTADTGGPGGWRGAGWPCYKCITTADFRGIRLTLDLSEHEVELVTEALPDKCPAKEVVQYCFCCGWELDSGCDCE